MEGELIALRVIHVLGGTFWAGSLLFMSFFLLPSLAEAGPAAGAVSAGLEKRKLLDWLPVVALLTVLSGLRLLMRASGGFGGAFFRTTQGEAYLVAAIAAILALVLGLTVSRPAMNAAGRLVAQLPDAAPDARAGLMAQAAALRLKSAKAVRVIALLVLLSALVMSVARYL